VYAGLSGRVSGAWTILIGVYKVSASDISRSIGGINHVCNRILFWIRGLVGLCLVLCRSWAYLRMGGLTMIARLEGGKHFRYFIHIWPRWRWGRTLCGCRIGWVSIGWRLV
jgi:hypothetical protein